MANIAGYRGVIEARNKFPRFFTGKLTAAGTFGGPQAIRGLMKWLFALGLHCYLWAPKGVWIIQRPNL
jgi:NAD/NADP transhydrogenase alpha subunit